MDIQSHFKFGNDRIKYFEGKNKIFNIKVCNKKNEDVYQKYLESEISFINLLEKYRCYSLIKRELKNDLKQKYKNTLKIIELYIEKNRERTLNDIDSIYQMDRSKEYRPSPAQNYILCLNDIAENLIIRSHLTDNNAFWKLIEKLFREDNKTAEIERFLQVIARYVECFSVASPYNKYSYDQLVSLYNVQDVTPDFPNCFCIDSYKLEKLDKERLVIKIKELSDTLMMYLFTQKEHVVGATKILKLSDDEYILILARKILSMAQNAPLIAKIPEDLLKYMAEKYLLRIG